MTRGIIRKINIENIHYFFLFQKNYRTQYLRKTVKKIRAKELYFLLVYVIAILHLWNPLKSEVGNEKSEVGSRKILLGFRTEQPPPRALSFSQGRGERLVMNRKGPWEGYRRLFPAFLCALIFIERETSGYEAGAGGIPLWPLAFCILYLR